MHDYLDYSNAQHKTHRFYSHFRVALNNLERNIGNGGIGRIIRDHEGSFVAAFAKNIGISTNNKVEVL